MTKMTILKVDPGACGFVAKITANSEDHMTTTIEVDTGCETITKMMQELGNTFNAYKLCLIKPGTGPLYEYAKENFPMHGACPLISAITKCVEAECQLAVKRNTTFEFLDN
jgi:hypothetical protein